MLANSTGRAPAVGVLLTACLCACAPLPRYAARPERSTLGCVHSVLASHQPLPRQDSQAHCLAAGLIARYCSVTEAWLAGIGKEIGDLFGPGDAEWRDLVSDKRGIACARHAPDDTELRACCE